MHTDRPGRFVDDGTTLTVDLHGCTVDAALHIIRRSLQEAYRRGRQKVEIIHGWSTSDISLHDRTIKNAFLDAIEREEYCEWVSGRTEDASGGRTSMWINIGARPNPKRIHVNDVVPPR